MAEHPVASMGICKVVEEVVVRGEPWLVERDGVPVVVIASHAELEQMRHLLSGTEAGS